MNEPDNKEEANVIGETEQTVTAEPVDLTGNQEVEENVTTEDFGVDEALKAEGENVVTEDTKDGQGFIDPDAGTQDDGANDHRLSTVKPKKDIPEEYTIEYLYNPNNRKVFPVNEDIVKQKHLIPCTKEGKLLPDNRRPSDLR